MKESFELGKSRIVCYMPAYNASRTIAGVIGGIVTEHWSFIDVLLVVDDGSVDDTAAILIELKRKYPKIELVQHHCNVGYGGAQKTAFRWALEHGADAVVMLHSDGQYPPAFLKDMLKPLAEGADVVGGSRIIHGDMRKGGMSLSRYWGTIFFTKLENLVFHQHLTSYHSGYRSYRCDAIKAISFETYSDSFNFDSEILVGAIRAGLRIAEVPIPTIYGKGCSSLKPVPYCFSLFHTIYKYLFGQI